MRKNLIRNTINGEREVEVQRDKVWEEDRKVMIEKDPLPRVKVGCGDAFKIYLRFNEVWKQLKEQHGVVPYSFHYSYSKRAHQI